MTEHMFSWSRNNHVYDGILFHEGMDAPVLDRITSGDYQLREDDILVASFPKSGTNWVLKILALLCRPHEMESLHKLPIEKIIGFLEFTQPGSPPLLDIMEGMPSPRVIYTHLQPRFLTRQRTVAAKKTKIVCLMRNPKDLLVSYYHFARMNGYLGRFTGTWSEYFEQFKAKKLVYGDWFEHVLVWWENKEKYDVHYVYYEDLHKDIAGCIRKMADFVGKRVTDEQLDRIVELSSFASMSELPVLGSLPKLDNNICPFMRKGQVGDWKNYFTPEENQYIDDLYREKIVGTGLEFQFQI